MRAAQCAATALRRKICGRAILPRIRRRSRRSAPSARNPRSPSRRRRGRSRSAATPCTQVTMKPTKPNRSAMPISPVIMVVPMRICLRRGGLTWPFVLQSVDQGPGSAQEPCVIAAAADELNPDRQPVLGGEQRQRNRRRAEQAPGRAKDRAARALDPGASPSAAGVRMASYSSNTPSSALLSCGIRTEPPCTRRPDIRARARSARAVYRSADRRIYHSRAGNCAPSPLP